MIIRLIAVIATAMASLVVSVSAAGAECSYAQEEVLLDGAVQIKTVKHCKGERTPEIKSLSTPPRDSDWDAPCVRSALAFNVDPVEFCDLPPDAARPPTVTPGIVAAACRRLPLPAAQLVIQPPNGRTLVNFETNFYTEQGEFTRTVTLLGRQVELRIWPASFGWRFGDGESDETTSPGAAYPDLEITHEYQRKGRVSPSVDTTYAAQFRVDGGPWRDVAGTVTITGSPQSLRVVEARPVLVGG
jgi:hypothetical protein